MTETTTEKPNKPRRRGAVGNINRLTSGMYGVARGRLGVRALVVGELPAGFETESAQAKLFRAQLEKATLASFEYIDIARASILETALAAHVEALLAFRHWKLNHATLTAAETLQFLSAITKASSARDKAIGSLKLSQPVDATDPWAELKAVRQKAVVAVQEPAPVAVDSLANSDGGKTQCQSDTVLSDTATKLAEDHGVSVIEGQTP